MTRPTYADIERAQAALNMLAWRYDAQNNPNGWPDLCVLIEQLEWHDHELGRAKADAVYGPGGERSPEGGGTIGGRIGGGKGLSRPTEARLDFGSDRSPRLRPEVRDPYYRALRDLRAGVGVELGQLVDSFRERLKKAGNYPMRTEQAG